MAGYSAIGPGGAGVRLVRRPLGWDREPADVLRLVRDDAHPVALFGAWAGDSDVVAAEPATVRSDPGDLADVFDATFPGGDGPAEAPGAFGGGWIGYLGYSGEARPRRAGCRGPCPPGGSASTTTCRRRHRRRRPGRGQAGHGGRADPAEHALPGLPAAQLAGLASGVSALEADLRRGDTASAKIETSWKSRLRTADGRPCPPHRKQPQTRQETIPVT